MTPEQCCAARALLGWSQDELAQVSQVHKSTIMLFELGKRPPYARSLDDLRDALEAAGVIFVEENGDGPGVRLRKPRAK
jgi:transcriptional regulator with XRE-family HTH domain